VQEKPARQITDFFKVFTIPRNRVPSQDVIEDEIAVALPKASPKRASAVDKRLSGSPVKPRSIGTNSMAKRSWNSSAHSTPTKRTLEQSPPKSSATLPDSSFKDGLSPSGPSSSLQRLQATTLPSPKLRSSPTPTEQVPLQQPTTFSSFSTLSSVPLSSQSFSKRIIKDGLQAVTNSDSGSADDSSEELADVEMFIPRKKMRMTPPGNDKAHAIEIPSTTKPVRQSARLSDKVVRSDRGTPRLPPSPPRTIYKHSLLKMGKQVEKEQKMDEKIAALEVRLREAEERSKAQVGREEMVDGTAIMAAVAADDSDEGERMLMAMKRTEAGLSEVKFSYFLDSSPKAGRSDFPVHSLPDERWCKVLRSDRDRTQACLTGYVAQLAKMGRLTRKTTKWFGFQLVHEARMELREAYVEIIRACAEHAPGTLDRSLVGLSKFYHVRTPPASHNRRDRSSTSSLSSVDDETQAGASQSDDEQVRCFCNSGSDDGNTITCEICDRRSHMACYFPQEGDGGGLPEKLSHTCGQCRASAEESKQRTAARLEITTSASGTPPGLEHMVQVIQYCAPPAGEEHIGNALVELAMANVDEQVMRDTALRFRIQDSIEALASSLSDVHPDIRELVQGRVIHDLLRKHSLSRLVQAQLVTALPASSPHIHYLRRMLAVHCVTAGSFMDELLMADGNPTPLTSDKWTSRLLEALQSNPDFAISESTDYVLLAALADVLDIAIDAGFRADPNFTQADLPANNSTTGPPFVKPTAPPQAEQAFNADIDALTARLRLTASRIKDVGAAHLRRTEAKSALERVVVRLEHTVRTRPKPRKGVFGEAVGGEGQRRFLEGFVRKVDDGGKRHGSVQDERLSVA